MSLTAEPSSIRQPTSRKGWSRIGRKSTFFSGDPPAISTLRGQLADNREWSRDPSRPAIVIGTVDLIGSALLFSGYRSSYKRRPLEAGLLGQDSLLVLDEAHLSKPFEKLLGSISYFQKSHGKPMRVVHMSATSGNANDSNSRFTLLFDADGKLTGEDEKDETIARRFSAKKRLTIITLNEKEKLADRLAIEAIKLVDDNSLRGNRIVVFVRKPDDAGSIADTIRKHGAKKNSPSPYAESVEVLTGTMRGLERDELVEKTVQKRFLDGDENLDLEENRKPVFLISTSGNTAGGVWRGWKICCAVPMLWQARIRTSRTIRPTRKEASNEQLQHPDPRGPD